MILITNESIGGVPSLHVVKGGSEDKELSTIFFFHGYTSAKEHNLHIAYLLAEKGFRVILPDALHHGERQYDQNDRDLKFWEIVINSIKELEGMKEELKRRGLIDDQIGVIGTSMGAITMYGALATYDWIKTAVSFMGTAYYQAFMNAQLSIVENRGLDVESMKNHVLSQIKPFDLSEQFDKLDGRPLLIWHGKEDQVVPYPFSEKLYQELESRYQDHPQHLKFLSEERTAHKVSRKAVLSSIEWFERYLSNDEVS